jgi:hypothetical protein
LLKETKLNEHSEALTRANADIATVPTHVRSWAMRTCRSTLGQHLELVVPLDRELLQQIIAVKGGRLSPFEDGFDDGGWEQSETQDAAEAGFVDALGFREVANRGMSSDSAVTSASEAWRTPSQSSAAIGGISW